MTISNNNCCRSRIDSMKTFKWTIPFGICVMQKLKFNIYIKAFLHTMGDLCFEVSFAFMSRTFYKWPDRPGRELRYIDCTLKSADFGLPMTARIRYNIWYILSGFQKRYLQIKFLVRYFNSAGFAP
ncbi:uncharacterized protein OCT59_017014 [Rhizophagus irregularis]|uniref:uncharacterized protein n=1 Tax=Rhizophagus irregularis TaxID=588596 RepID=UPI00332AAB11|nr:hypothetical protein OCT59_017014 [Rhizophagus irregularis]